MNFEEIKARLIELKVTPEMLADWATEDYYGHDNEDGDYVDEDSMKALMKEFGSINSPESYGGEGEGETYYVVVYFKKHDVLMKLDAHYQSYDGTDWSYTEFKEAMKVPKTGFEYKTI